MTMTKSLCNICLLILASVLFPACNTVDDDRIPAVPVSINLSTPDLWTTYGVSGYGSYRLFVRELGEPRNFAYTASTATGYGGVLLISGVNPFTLEAGVPMAYDLACPVERQSDIRVRMETDGMISFAVCPECGSHYDVVERGGAATSGPALSERYGLTRYECRPTVYGGYLIISM